MLREETRPVLPVGRDPQTPLAPPSENVCTFPWHNRLDCINAFGNDLRVDRIKGESNTRNPTCVLGDASVTEVHAEEIGISTEVEFRRVRLPTARCRIDTGIAHS